MRRECVNEKQKPSRRAVLRAAAASAVGAIVARAAARAADAFDDGTTTKPAEVPRRSPPQEQDAGLSPADSRPAAADPQSSPWWVRPEPEKSRVVMVSGARISRGVMPQPPVLDAMLSQAVQALTGRAGERAAWRAVLGDRRRIVVKFNSVGADELGTNESVARSIVRQLRDADYDPAGVALVECEPRISREFGCRPAERGWGISIPVGGRDEQLARWVSEADAIINVGFLKTHRFAGMSACMINLSHGIIRRPALYHDDGCSPFVGQVIGNNEVAEKLRINICNALRVVVRGGPDVHLSAVQEYGALLLGFDPVAVDFVALNALGEEQKRLEIGSGPAVPYLQDAVVKGIGRGEWALVERLNRELVVSG